MKDFVTAKIVQYFTTSFMDDPQYKIAGTRYHQVKLLGHTVSKVSEFRPTRFSDSSAKSIRNFKQVVDQ
jgi:hypothetical protein